MKKLITIILLLCPILGVKAKEYYTPYGKEEIVEKIPIVDKDLIEVKEEKEYLFYNIQKEGNYFLDEEVPNGYVKTDLWTYTNYSDWSNKVIEWKENREIESRTVYHYQTMKPITLIKISKIEPIELLFEYVKIYKGVEEITFEKKVIDGDIYFQLSQPCYVDELQIVFTLINNTDLEKHFQLEFLYDEEHIAMEVYSRYWFVGAYNSSFQFRNMNIVEFLYDEEQTSLEKVEYRFHRNVWIETEYRYKDKMYYYERENKIYNKEYQKESSIEYPYKDETTERNIIKIRQRNKIEVEDMIILNKKENLNQYIKTDIPYTLSDNINWNKSGIYEIVIKTEYGNARHPIYLNLKDFTLENTLLNTKNKLNLCNQNYKQLSSELDKANATIVSLSNETSNEIEKETIKENMEENIPVQKQNLVPGILLLLLITLVGITTGRIMTIKKKV